MSGFPTIFRRFIPQLLYMIVLPIFCFAFLLIYRPMNVHNFMGTEYFGIHITLVSCIMFLSLVLLRLLYYFLPLTKLNYASYIAWCLGEIIFISFFVAIYLWLVLCPDQPYLEMLSVSFKYRRCSAKQSSRLWRTTLKALRTEFTWIWIPVLFGRRRTSLGWIRTIRRALLVADIRWTFRQCG